MANRTSPLKSAVRKGTEFEQRSLSILQNCLSMSLSRIGGRSDGGIDLQGWWWLPSLAFTHAACDSLFAPTGFDDGLRRRIRVLAQCKATQKKMGPNFVREMEGVLYQYSNQCPVLGKDASFAPGPSQSGTTLPSPHSGDPKIPTVAMLISQSSFTKSAILRAMSSSVPFFLLHLPEHGPGGDADINPVGSAIWNRSLYGEDGLLGGQVEVRWERRLGGSGKPRLWWKDKPLQSWVPA